MRFQYKLRRSFVWVTIASVLGSLIVAILYFNNSEVAIWSILNNLIICIFTGCVIGCIQSFIGYANEKYMAVLSFYKEAIMLERSIINHPFMRSGFINPREGLQDIQVLIGRFYDDFKFSYLCLFIGNNRDKVLAATSSLFELYETQIKTFKDMENALCDSLRYLDKSHDELIQEGIDIPTETDKINFQLQSLEKEIEKAYNDSDSQEKRTRNYEIIEKYLFSKKGEIQK